MQANSRYNKHIYRMLSSVFNLMCSEELELQSKVLARTVSERGKFTFTPHVLAFFVFNFDDYIDVCILVHSMF